jgi:hypothetical protein
MGNDPKDQGIEEVFGWKGPAAELKCWPFLLLSKKYAPWTSLEKDAIMMAGEGTF